jgi:pilus assembly protein FimV
VRRLALVPTLIAALLLPSGAHALGLGEIEIQSALNQRLDAEIPLRGVPAGQGGEIDVSLASEEAFENVGLDRPFALTRLRFAVKQRDGGDYYVHVTSPKSIVEPFLSFLVEVDWAGGNLLREYTVLLDPPVFTSEDDPERSGGGTTDTARTSDANDDAGVTGEVERGTASSQTDADAAADDTRSASGSGQTGSDDGSDKPVFLEVEEREERARAEADAGSAAGSGGGSTSRSAGAPGQYGPVGDGETLWSIASRLNSGDMTVQQMMIALLRYNPDAFRGNNVNRLKKGYVLRVPDADRVTAVSAQRALAEVRAQNGVWQEMQLGVRSGTSVAASEQGTGDTGSPSAAGAGSDDAELSIVGADEGGASSDEAASATGSSSEDESEKLQLAREQLESTRLEKEELESRVAELEQTVSKMEKLLEVRDERLSALQNELRELEGRQAGEQESGTAADEAAASELASADDAEGTAVEDPEAGTDDESAATGEDDDQTLAAADGDTGTDGDLATTGTDGGSDDGASTTAEDGENASGTTASADGAGDDQTQSAEATASDGEQASESYIPDDKRATDADRGLETTRTQEPEETWLDQVNGVIASVAVAVAGVGGGLLGGPVGLGLAAAVVLLGGGLILMRRRREASAADDLEDFEPIHSDSDLASFDADSSGQFEAPASGDDDDTGGDPVSANAEDAQSALMEEEFDFSSLDEEASAETPVGGAVDAPAGGIDDEEAEKDDTVAEADVYLAYGLHQQAEDLLRLALREQSGNAMYHEKLLETLYASGKSEEFIEEAETFRGLVAGPESRLWQRVLAMGRDIAPRHELFAEGDTEYTAADVQPARPAGTDLELDDASSDIDFGLDDEPESAGGGDTDARGEPDDDEFSSTMMLDSADFEAVEGDGGLVGPEDDSAPGVGAEAGQSVDAGDAQEDDDDLEFDLGDLDGLSEEGGAPSPAATAPETGDADSDDIDFDLDDDDGLQPAEQGSGHSAREGAASDDGSLDFDLDFDEPESAAVESGEAESTGSSGLDTETAAENTEAEAYDGGLDFDFDLEETPADSSALSSGSAALDAAAAAEPSGGDENDGLEIGDLEIGELDSVEADSGADASLDSAQSRDADPAPGGDADEPESDAFDLSNLDTSLEEAGDEGAAEPARSAGEQFAGDELDDAFDLSDLDAVGGGESDDDGAFNLDDLAVEPDGPEAASSAPAPETEPEMEASASEGAPVASGDADSAPDEDDEFDTMLDLARAYIDMGDPESATNALEEVAASGSDKQRNEAQSLLDSVR